MQKEMSMNLGLKIYSMDSNIGRIHTVACYGVLEDYVLYPYTNFCGQEDV